MVNKKEELINLLKESIEIDSFDNGEFIENHVNYEEIAERLLERVIVLPFKIGTLVYEVFPQTVTDKHGLPTLRFSIMETEHFKYFSTNDEWTFATLEEAQENAKQRQEIFEEDKKKGFFY